MSRAHVVFTALLFAAGSAFGVSGSYLVGSVGLAYIQPPGQKVGSSAEVDCFDFWGAPNETCVFSGNHWIEYSTGGIALARPYNAFGQYWIDYLPTQTTAETCYRAKLSGVVADAGRFTQVWGSAQVCTPPDVPDKPPPTDCPVIIDLDGHGFHLTGLDDPVWFDLDASGQAEEIGWTAAGVRNGFLCLDRNHDGAITDGRELFGQVTPLADGQPAKIGYLAMAELDRAALGGNGDGFLGPEDAAFQGLCVWVDGNHDGISQLDEILTLEQAGIVRLAYDYVETRKQDSHGNLFRYKSKAWGLNPAGRVRQLTTYDVFFVQR